MSTQYKVFSAWTLPNGDLALAGLYSGDPLVKGQRISATAPNGKIILEIQSIGIVDPNLVEETKRQGIIAKFVLGDIAPPSSVLEGVTFETE